MRRLCLVLVLFVVGFPKHAHSRPFNNTGVGKIALEEAWFTPDLLWFLPEKFALPPGVTRDDLHSNLVDIHVQRLQDMDATGVDYSVLSLTSPGPQGVSDPGAAQKLAYRANDDLAALISNNTMRFGAFAALAMHNATWAALELKRSVNELGFLGALINDYQQSGSDNSTKLFLDQPEYDPFWQMVQDLDVPVYMHPRFPIPSERQSDYSGRWWLTGPPHSFTSDLALHVLGLCTNGIFDRFPKVKVIVGHMGERIPSDLWRIDHHLIRAIPEGLPMKKPLQYYWANNLYVTTSGAFSTSLLNFHIQEIGSDRIMYSVDYPYEFFANASTWFDNTELTKSDRAKIARENAIKILKLDADVDARNAENDCSSAGGHGCFLRVQAPYTT